MRDRSGQRLDNFRLVRLLGAGSFGEVYLAVHVYRKVQFAVKVLPQLADNDLLGFLNEARTIRLKHPHIVQILDFGVDKDSRTPFIVMEYIPHGTLRERYPKGTRLPIDTVVPYIKQVADALQYAHDENIVHRDVKPENILLRSDNEALLSDFGIATIVRSSRSQSILEMAGTIAYMAPEQIQGKPVVASDQYALGVIVYECLSGERPFNGGPIEIATQHMVIPPPSLRSKVPTLSPDIEQVVLTALEKEPSKRFASVEAFANALEQASKLPKRPAPVVPNLISPEPIIFTPPSSPKEQSVNVAPSSFQQFSDFLPNTILPTPEKPLLSPSLLPAFLETSPSSKPVVMSELSSRGEERSKNVASPTSSGNKIRRSRLFYLLLASIIVVMMGIIGSGTYYYLRPNASINQTLQSAQALITKANNEVATNPTSALRDLASAQNSLRALLQDPSLTASQHSSVLQLLQDNLAKSVQTAIVSYNTQSSITLLCPSNATTNAINNGSTGTQAKIITQVMAKVKGKSAPVVYALGTDNKLYQVNNNSLLVVPLPIAADTKVINLASNGSQLVLLTQQPTKAGASTPNDTYTLNLFSPVQAKPDHPSFASSSQIDPRLIKSDQVPSLIAAAGTDVYVVFGSNTVQTTALIIDYFPKANRPFAQTSQSTFTFSYPIKSVAAFPNHELFFLLDGGSLQSIQLLSGAQATNVLVDKPMPQPLATSTTTFLWQTPVPTVSQAGTNALDALGTTSSSALGVSTENGVPHLYIMDTTLHRILDLKMKSGGSAGASTPGITPTSTTTGGGVANNNSSVTLQLAKQYVSPTLLAQPKSMAVDTQGSQVNVLSQNSPAMPALISFHTNPQNTSCP